MDSGKNETRARQESAAAELSSGRAQRDKENTHNLPGL